MAKEHRHQNPSPSHAAGAWCNGTQDDPGCGQLRPMGDFPEGQQSYFIDGRYGPESKWDAEKGWTGIRSVADWRAEVQAAYERGLQDGLREAGV